ncbi:hypothetical protein G9A89_000700 [Geosiphon pyriformis]|nr:hypothetical protein G9A89_000700 [Geosiphon pyriformis]
MGMKYRRYLLLKPGEPIRFWDGMDLNKKLTKSRSIMPSKASLVGLVVGRRERAETAYVGVVALGSKAHPNQFGLHTPQGTPTLWGHKLFYGHIQSIVAIQRIITWYRIYWSTIPPQVGGGPSIYALSK